MKSILYTFFSIIAFLFILSNSALAKTIELNQKYKFKAGDNSARADPAYNDDQFYLNGTFIGQNNLRERTSDYDFQNGNGFYIPERKYILSVDDPAIKWDEENVIAIRIFDQGGGGGLYAGNASVEMADISRYFIIDKKTLYVYHHHWQAKSHCHTCRVQALPLPFQSRF